MFYGNIMFRWLRISLATRNNLFWLLGACSLISCILIIFSIKETTTPEVPHFVSDSSRNKIIEDEHILPIVPDDPLAENTKKSFTILFWNNGERMVRRFVRSYGSVEKDPLRNCKVKNCKYRIDGLQGLNESDAVVFHLHRIKGPDDVPPYRFPHQRWVFFTDESPQNTFYLARKNSMKYYNGIFNWSMTFTSDADVPVPYGRTVKLNAVELANPLDLPNFFYLNSKETAVVGSNCGGSNYRWDYVRSLKKYTNVDMYGACGNLKCPGGYMGSFCPLIRGYKFYIAFENTNCREYVTEKMWWNAYNNDAVPIVMGASKKEYETMCPPHSFIHVDDFDSPEALAKYVNYLSKNETAYNAYFSWKSFFKIVNEHGYFHSDSMHICHLCEALNDPNRPPKVYNNLEDRWSPEVSCRQAKWKPLKS